MNQIWHILKTLHLSIVVIASIGILIVPSIQNVNAVPYLSPADLYKQSDMVFYGQVITKEPGLGSDYYYQVKVETFFKNPQRSDSITVASHAPDSPRAGYPQFEVGDKAIFYITTRDGINTISPFSQIAGGACDVHSFLGPALLPNEPILRGQPANNPRLTDVNGNALERVLVNHQVVLSYDGIYNNYPESRTIPVVVSITNQDNGQQIFNKTQIFPIQACDILGTVQWSFMPAQSGSYMAIIDVDNKSNTSITIQVQNDSSVTSVKPVLSPLKQLKTGVSSYDTICQTNLVLIFKSEDGTPACVRPQTKMQLLKIGWGVEGISRTEVTISRNAENSTNIQHVKNTTDAGMQKIKNSTISGLTLLLSIDSEYQSPPQPLQVDVSLNNTSQNPLTLANSDNWPRNDLTSGMCSNLPIGISILKGYYTEQNVTGARSLVIYQPVPCPLPPPVKSYVFEPLSAKATQECDTLFSCTGPVDMKTHLEINGFIDNNGQHKSFTAGSYTIVAGDEWGDVSILHFTEAYTTAYDKISKYNESQNRITNNMTQVTGLTVHNQGGSIKLSYSDLFNETEYYTGNVGQVKPGFPVHISISDPYDMFVPQYAIPSSSIAPDGSFNFTHSFIGKFGQDVYTLDFTYGDQKYTLGFTPVVPP